MALFPRLQQFVLLLSVISNLHLLFAASAQQLTVCDRTPCLHFGTTAGAWPSLWRPSSRASLRRRVSGPLPMHIPPPSLFQVSRFRHLREFHLRLSIHSLGHYALLSGVHNDPYCLTNPGSYSFFFPHLALVHLNGKA